MELPFWLRVIESLAQVATPILIAIGGVFAYYKFFKQGEHDPRLQPSVTSELIIVKDDVAYMIATVSVQNNGQVDVNLKRESCALMILGRKDRSGWNPADVWYEVFPGQSAVQANEVIEEKIWIERDLKATPGEVALCLELAISAEGGPDWRASEVISLLDSGQSSSGG